jgi:anthranilate phosphoribosyltransferase
MTVTPRDLGVRKVELHEISGMDPEGSVELMFRLLYGIESRSDPRMEIVLVNAAAALIVGDFVDDFKDGLEKAYESVESGAAYGKLRALIASSSGDSRVLEEMENKLG